MKKIAKMILAVGVCLLILFGCGTEEKESTQTESQKLESENQGTENTEIESETENSEDTNTEEGDLASQSTMATPSNSGALQVIGTQLCDEKGNPVMLRGLSTHGMAWFPDYVNEAAVKEFHEEWGANAWIELLNERGISYCGWNISNKAETSAIFNSSCTKTSGWTEEDLSESGKWQYHMLRKYQLGK